MPTPVPIILSVSPSNPPPTRLLPPCGPESPVTMVTTERWLKPFENHHTSPHHMHMHAYTCYLYEVMVIIPHVVECSYEGCLPALLCTQL